MSNYEGQEKEESINNGCHDIIFKKIPKTSWSNLLVKLARSSSCGDDLKYFGNLIWYFDFSVNFQSCAAHSAPKG
jgi:hypothetical protein